MTLWTEIALYNKQETRRGTWAALGFVKQHIYLQDPTLNDYKKNEHYNEQEIMM